MKITHYGHACVLVETDAARILFDPGAYSTGFDELRDLDLVLITHEHPDHAEPERLGALLAANPDAMVVTNESVAKALGLSEARIVAGGDELNEKGVKLAVTGADHAVIHPDLPHTANVGFVVDDTVWHPGDALESGQNGVPVLLAPLGGPWMKASDLIDFVRSVEPKVVIPIHQEGLATVHQNLHLGLLKNLAPKTTITVLERGVATEVAA